MHYISIKKLEDLQQVIETPLIILQQEDKDYHNMWVIEFDIELIKQIKIKNLNQFLDDLLESRYVQLLQINYDAIFYLWFDEQALQLRFNFIFGNNISLPFGCKLNMLCFPEPILQNFITRACKFAIEGDVIEFLNSHENQCDDDEVEYTLDVYVRIINIKKN